MKTLFKKINIFSILILLCLLTGGCAAGVENGNSFKAEQFEYSEVLECNALKGFVSWGEGKQNIPSSLSYIPVPLKEIVKNDGSFNFDYLSGRLKSLQNNGGQAVVRIITESPGEEYTSSYIYDVLKVKKLSYKYEEKTYYTPDYTDENLIKFFVKLIEEFGKTFDGDNRIAVIQSGLIGHWGEWHCYYLEEAMATKEQEKEVLDAYGKNFKQTLVTCRRPNAGGMKENVTTGIYNDMFYSDEDDDYMDELFDIAGIWNRWEKGMITGEFAPGLQLDFVEYIADESYLTKYKEKLKHFHNSSMLMAELYGLSNDKIKSIGLKNIMHASNMMGYDFEVKEALFSNNTFTVKIKNNGVAPFYYNWKVTISIADSTGIVEEVETDWQLKELMCGRTVSYNVAVEGKNLSAGDYKVLLSVKNPMEKGYPLRFSNVQQDKDFEGYLTLGEFRVF